MGRAAAPSNHGAAFPQRHAQAGSRRACVRCCLLAHLGGRNERGRKIEEGGRQGLKVAAILQIYTQQSIESRHGRWRGSRGVRVDGAERAGGTPCCRIGRRIKSTNIKRERDGAMAVGGWKPLNQGTQQPTKIRCRPWEGHGGGAQLWRNVWGGAFCNRLAVRRKI